MTDNELTDVYQGCTTTLKAEATQGAHAFNLQGYDVYFIINNKIKVSGNVTNPTKGYVEFYLSGKDTNISEGLYQYTIQAVKDDEKYVLAQDNLLIRGV